MYTQIYGIILLFVKNAAISNICHIGYFDRTICTLVTIGVVILVRWFTASSEIEAWASKPGGGEHF